MNDELNSQNSQKNIYQGNYDNDYKDGLKAAEDFEDDSFGEFLNEEPKYMNLGAPRDRDEEDFFHHEKNMKSLFSGDSKLTFSSLGLTSKKSKAIMKAPKQPKSISMFFARYFNLHLHGPHFKLVKTDALGSDKFSTKIKWTMMTLFFAMSVVSFTAQSFIFIKNEILGGVSSAVVDSVSIQNSNLNTPAVVARSTEDQGSDDGTDVNGSSTGLKIDRAPQYRLNDVGHFPALLAKSFLVADLKTGEVIKESQDTKAYPIASMSKLMTALIAHQKMDPKQMAIVSKSSYNTFGTQGELLLGESIRVSDLMYPLLMESSNDGAEVIADAYGHVDFMSEMNKKALSLGMNDTYYNDPSGLDAKNVSTVEDEFKLAKYIYEKAPVIFDMTRVRQFEIINHRWYNKNKILNINSFLGGKNGFIDESRQTTASLFDIQLAKGGKRIIAIVLLKTNDREGDIVKIINFLKKNGYYEEVAP